jgi:hypothetical protein
MEHGPPADLRYSGARHTGTANAHSKHPVTVIMLRLIGIIVVILLLIGPLLVRIGVVDHTGLLQDFVDLETRAFVDLVDAIRSVWDRFA